MINFRELKFSVNLSELGTIMIMILFTLTNYIINVYSIVTLIKFKFYCSSFLSYLDQF